MPVFFMEFYPLTMHHRCGVNDRGVLYVSDIYHLHISALCICFPCFFQQRLSAYQIVHFLSLHRLYAHLFVKLLIAQNQQSVLHVP